MINLPADDDGGDIEIERRINISLEVHSQKRAINFVLRHNIAKKAGPSTYRNSLFFLRLRLIGSEKDPQKTTFPLKKPKRGNISSKSR